MCTRLEFISEHHESDFSDWLSSEPDTYSFIVKSAPDADTASSLFGALLAKSQAPDFSAWLVLDQNSVLVGYTELKRTEKAARENERELIYAIRERFRGKGHATRAVRQLSKKCAFEVSAYVNPQNEASLRVLQKNEFKQQPTDCAGLKFVHVAYT